MKNAVVLIISFFFVLLKSFIKIRYKLSMHFLICGIMILLDVNMALINKRYILFGKAYF